ncbi:hypothetical protein LZ30DRAFT_818891 [Colletotrichum cereale]|nr:hypothetical protein LZ30DRAFT_818891 [Colletotrichum cereale]
MLTVPIMAKVSDLPTELLLTTASLLWSQQPAKKRLLVASISRRHHSLMRSLHHERSSVINIPSACKAFHKAPEAEIYRFVSFHENTRAMKMWTTQDITASAPGHYENDKACPRTLCAMLFYHLRNFKEITVRSTIEQEQRWGQYVT